MSAATPDLSIATRRDGIDLLTWPLFAGRAVDALVTTRHGGVSTGPYATLNLGLHVGDEDAAVLENRRRAARVVGLELGDLVFCNQAHGREVVVVGEEHRGRGASTLAEAIDNADALVTTTPGLGLVVMVADCVPIVLFDPVVRTLACVHAGWRGTVARVAEAAVMVMAGLGSRPGDILAGVGPANPALRYQVGEEVAEAARAAFGKHTSSVIQADGPGQWRFDLWAANRLTLTQAGLDPEHVAVAAIGSDDDSFFSDRAVRPCGRFAAVAALRSSVAR